MQGETRGKNSLCTPLACFISPCPLLSEYCVRERSPAFGILTKGCLYRGGNSALVLCFLLCGWQRMILRRQGGKVTASVQSTRYIQMAGENPNSCVNVFPRLIILYCMRHFNLRPCVLDLAALIPAFHVICSSQDIGLGNSENIELIQIYYNKTCPPACSVGREVHQVAFVIKIGRGCPTVVDGLTFKNE